MIDAIHVPCCPQCGSLFEVFRSVKSLPVLTAPSRSLTSGFTPLSMTATVTLAPSVSCQADCTSSMLSTHACWSLTELAGAAAAGIDVATPSTAASATPASARPPRGRTAQKAAAAREGGPGQRPPAGQARQTAQHPGVPGQCGAGSGAPTLASTTWATPLAMVVISASA